MKRGSWSGKFNLIYIRHGMKLLKSTYSGYIKVSHGWYDIFVVIKNVECCRRLSLGEISMLNIDFILVLQNSSTS